MGNQDIIKKLRSNNTDIILDTLQYISQEGNKEILGEVIQLLIQTSETIIRDRIIQILENLREQDCAPVIVKAIEDPSNEDILSILVSSSWKNSLNFEEYIETFTNVFIQSDFQLAFDALTVIDNFENISTKNADLCLIKLNNSIEDSKDDKQPLFQELISIIKNLKENPAN